MVNASRDDEKSVGKIAFSFFLPFFPSCPEALTTPRYGSFLLEPFCDSLFGQDNIPIREHQTSGPDAILSYERIDTILCVVSDSCVCCV